MPVLLRDLRHQDAAITAGRAQATVAELEAELAERKAQAERSRVEAERQAKQAQAERAQAERVGRQQLTALEKDLADALAAGGDERPALEVRGLARLWLHGGIPDGTPASAALEDLARHDPAATALFALHQRAGAVLVHLGGAAGLDEGHELFVRGDDLECACWRALMARVRWLAGEEA